MVPDRDMFTDNQLLLLCLVPCGDLIQLPQSALQGWGKQEGTPSVCLIFPHILTYPMGRHEPLKKGRLLTPGEEKHTPPTWCPSTSYLPTGVIPTPGVPSVWKPVALGSIWEVIWPGQSLRISKRIFKAPQHWEPLGGS